MPEFLYDPPLPPSPTQPALPIVQTIRMVQAGEGSEIAIAHWHCLDPKTGVVQLLDITVHAPHRRQGHGKRLLAATIAQCRAWHTAHNANLRRIWAPLRQKDQVIARAFFIHNGFSHIATVRDLLPNEDALVYFRTFD